MTKWKKDATKFPVSVSYNEKRGAECIIPKPVIETLEHPKKITFVLKGGKKISVLAGVLDSDEEDGSNE